jgi:Niemann-Pick C1 protein
MSRAIYTFAAGAFALASVASAESLTPLHEAGRCAIRGHCGKKSFFGKELPCVDNGLAAEPEDDVRKTLVELCGAKWETGPVCCDKNQVCDYFPQFSA